MALIVADRVLETSTSTGIGPFELDGPKLGYRGFFDVLVPGDTTYYAIVDPATGQWETGVGTIGAIGEIPVVNRSVFESSNGGSVVSFGPGVKDVFITQVAANYPYNSYSQVAANSGTSFASGNNDVLEIIGSNGISTQATGGNVTITPAYGTPVSVGNTNAQGAANTFARSNHVHAHGNQTNPAHHAVATTADNGFMSAADKTKLNGIETGATADSASATAPPAIAATGSAGTDTNTYANSDHTHAGVTSFNGRQGAVTPQQADYDAFFTTPAEAAAAAPVQNFNGRTGNITPQQADYDAFFTTPAEAAAAAPVQSVNGQTGDVVIEAGGPQMLSSVHSATQANTTTTAADLTGQVFTLPPGKTIRIQGNLIFTGAATTTGAFYGFRVAHGAGANGNVQGSWNAEVAITSAAAASGLADGDAINVAGGATAASGVLGTATVAGNNSAWIMLTLVNRSTNADATVALQFRSEVAGSAVTAQIGTSAVAIIG